VPAEREPECHGVRELQPEKAVTLDPDRASASLRASRVSVSSASVG
jgi:hypothetical protein